MNSVSRAVPRALVAGNWKMHGTRASFAEIETLALRLSEMKDDACEVVVCPPATLVQDFAARCPSPRIAFGGQDCHFQSAGAFTGDISCQMLADAGASYVIVGHSERRSLHLESDDLVRRKAEAAQACGLTSIICLGETRDQRDSGQTLQVITQQLDLSVPAESTAGNTVIAYEPVWAIGTGVTPSEAEIEEVHTHIRQSLLEKWGTEGAMFRLLYGGSVKPSNAREILLITNVNGALVGGASLKAEDFVGIISVYAV